MLLDDLLEHKDNPEKNEIQEVKEESKEVKAEEIPTVQVDKTLKVEQQQSTPVKPEVIVEPQPEIKKKRTLFDRLYKESSEMKRRTISAILLCVYLAIFFILALFSDNLMLITGSAEGALGVAPFIISLFMIASSIWTVWFVTKEITKNFMVVKNHGIQRQLFSIMLTSILLVTLIYFWSCYFWAPVGGMKSSIQASTRSGMMITFVVVGVLTLIACSTLSWFAFYKNGQTIKKSFIGAALVVCVTFFYIFLYYTVCARNWSIMLLIITVAFMCDVGAYFGGTKLGKHKLAPNTSPKKTWEGLAIGLVCGTLCGILLLVMYSIPVWTSSISSGNDNVSNFALQYQVWGWQIAGSTPSVGSLFTKGNEITPNNVWWVAGVFIPIIFSITAAGGDLIFSKFKRSVAIKDFGTFIPGHGGLLDRFDSVIFTTLVFVGFSIFLCMCSYGLDPIKSPLLSNLATLAN